MLSCCKIAHGKLKDAVQCADFAFIVGAPKEETNLIFRLVDPEVRKLRLELGQGQNESLLVKLNGISDRGNYIDIQKGVRNIAPLVHLIQVDEVEAPSLEAFEKIFMSAKPCVLKNLISDWKAIEKWPHLHFFRNSYGHRQVPIEVYEGENRELKEQTMSLKSFIDEFIIPSCLVDQGKEIGKGKVAYLAQHSLFDQLPELQSHFSPPKYIDANTDAEIVKCSIWFGTSDTITPLHYDSYNNFFMQIAGFKCVVLFPNDETEKLYPIVDSKHSTAAQGNISAVDVGNPDTLSYPLYEKATGYKVLLKPGDTLFIPKGAWHYVQSLTPSLSINFFWNIKK
uniref:JmjC domain-containing protein n=2 Tax=Aplanochytrium stocchinoi TaxID=215587 RepID=A0A6S8AUG6_9STRA|mmetsp:Transcript_4145/g.4836  ORF Transcript_4145/g.4836 Transcript_4145/m.4836 type:complete len:339 (+) Transcript_4145:232-1248(+)